MTPPACSTRPAAATPARAAGSPPPPRSPPAPPTRPSPTPPPSAPPSPRETTNEPPRRRRPARRPRRHHRGKRPMTPHALAGTLPSHAAGLPSDPAAAELICAHHTWLTRTDFVTGYIDAGTRHDRHPYAYIDR